MSLSCEFLVVVLAFAGCVADLECAVITTSLGLRRRLRRRRSGSLRKPRRVKGLSVAWILGCQTG